MLKFMASLLVNNVQLLWMESEMAVSLLGILGYLEDSTIVASGSEIFLGIEPSTFISGRLLPNSCPIANKA